MSKRPEWKRGIHARNGYTCVYCGLRHDPSGLHVEHFHPKSKGGNDHPSNLTTACVRCNLLKADLEPLAFLDKMKARMEESRRDWLYYRRVVRALTKHLESR